MTFLAINCLGTSIERGGGPPGLSKLNLKFVLHPMGSPVQVGADTMSCRTAGVSPARSPHDGEPPGPTGTGVYEQEDHPKL